MNTLRSARRDSKEHISAPAPTAPYLQQCGRNSQAARRIERSSHFTGGLFMRSRLFRAFRSARVCVLLPLTVLACLGLSPFPAVTAAAVLPLCSAAPPSARLWLPLTPPSAKQTPPCPSPAKTSPIRVEINSPTALDTTANPPKINILGPGSTTVTNGQQPLTAVTGDANGLGLCLQYPRRDARAAVHVYHLRAGLVRQQRQYALQSRHGQPALTRTFL